jgi:hypothetical protein
MKWFSDQKQQSQKKMREHEMPKARGLERSKHGGGVQGEDYEYYSLTKIFELLKGYI